MNTEKYKEYYEYLNHNPAKFIEQLYGIKLFPFQKVIVNAMYKGKQIFYKINPYYKYQKYMRLCFAYMNMKDDAKIVISSANDDKLMSKEEFGEWLKNEYWR